MKHYSWLRRKAFAATLGAMALGGLGLAIGIAWAQVEDVVDDEPRPLASLKTVAVPEPANLADFIKNRQAAIALGKALFWDMQVGSDGIQACASCHFQAGADNRAKNQLSPGLLAGDSTFQAGGPNYQLTAGDFPFRKLTDPGNRLSAVLSDSNDVVSSQGVFKARFVDIIPGSAEDEVSFEPDTVFHVNSVNVRRVEPRNTPSNINAVFNFRNFWDGRAKNDFNGVSPFGSLDPNAFVLKAVTRSELQQVRVSLENSSLASQSVGPALSPFEMSADGRTFANIGRKLGKKLLSLRPLAQQTVAPDDSVLGPFARRERPGLQDPATGIALDYPTLTMAAFRPEWWDSNVVVTADQNGNLTFSPPPNRPLTTDEYTQMEWNFSLFWGIALQMYQATLIANDTPLDRFLEGSTDALTAQQRLGLEIFRTKGRCINCHSGPELTNASVTNVRSPEHGFEHRLELMRMGDGWVKVYDNGFYNIGVRPTAEDAGVGGLDPFGNPLSDTRLAQQGKGLFVGYIGKVAVDGAFKAPGLRNVELTAPYFHNGGQATLRQVVEFYNRGGDFHEANFADLDPDIQNLGLTEDEKEALVAFLKALTDERVRYHKAPFDHPQILLPDGHPGDDNVVTDDGTGKATDQYREIPAVGASGLPAPLPNFLE